MRFNDLTNEQVEVLKGILAFCILDHRMFGANEFTYQLSYDDGVAIRNSDHNFRTTSFTPIISFFEYSVPDCTEEFASTIGSLARSLTNSLGVSLVNFDYEDIGHLLIDKDILEKVETLSSVIEI